MDAILLLLEAAGMVLLLRWTLAARGDSGLLAWRLPASPRARPTPARPPSRPRP